MAETGVPAPGGEAGFSLAERLWHRVPGSNPHAPDEWRSLEAFERGVRAVTLFHERLGAH